MYARPPNSDAAQKAMKAPKRLPFPGISNGIVTRSVQSVELPLGCLGITAVTGSLADAATARVHLGVTLTLELVVEDARWEFN